MTHIHLHFDNLITDYIQTHRRERERCKRGDGRNYMGSQGQKCRGSAVAAAAAGGGRGGGSYGGGGGGSGGGGGGAAAACAPHTSP